MDCPICCLARATPSHLEVWQQFEGFAIPGQWWGVFGLKDNRLPALAFSPPSHTSYKLLVGQIFCFKISRFQIWNSDYNNNKFEKLRRCIYKPGKLQVWARLTPPRYSLWECSLRVFSKGGSGMYVGKVVVTQIKCLKGHKSFFGQVMSPHHSDQKGQTWKCHLKPDLGSPVWLFWLHSFLPCSAI